MRRRSRAIGAAVMVGALLVATAACGDDSDDDAFTTTEAPADTGSTTTVTAGGPSSTVAETGGDQLPDGTSFGYITTLVSGHNEIAGEFDLAQLFTGAEAQQAAAEDGSEAFDYYVRNVNPKLRKIVVDPAAEVLDVDYDDCCESKPTTVEQFIEDRDAKQEQRTAVYLTIEDGKVTKIAEQYFP